MANAVSALHCQIWPPADNVVCLAPPVDLGILIFCSGGAAASAASAAGSAASAAVSAGGSASAASAAGAAAAAAVAAGMPPTHCFRAALDRGLRKTSTPEEGYIVVKCSWRPHRSKLCHAQQLEDRSMLCTRHHDVVCLIDALNIRVMACAGLGHAYVV